jgi:hypothetical protein
MKKILLSIFIFSGMLFSCNQEILDRTPLDIISSAVVWDDPALVEAYVADVYNSLPFMHYGNLVNLDDNNRYDLPMLETLTDQAGGARWNRAPAIMKVGNITSTGGLIEMWLYPQIRKMNEFYEYTKDSKLDVDRKNTFTGCIKFVEAFSYFEMAKRYGAIPVILTAQKLTDPKEELYPHRTPELEVYKHAIKLLDEILQNNLLKDSEKAGYPTKGAVNALKARVALYSASIARFSTVQLDGLLGVPKNDEAAFWQLAYNSANLVITSGKYSLYNNYATDLPKRFFRMSIDKVNPERIFVKNYDGVNIGHSYDFTMAPVGFAPLYIAASAAPYLDFVESFEKTDGSSSTIPREWQLNDKLVTTKELFGGYDPRMEGAIFCEGSLYQGKEVAFYKGLRLPNGTILDSKTGSYQGVSSWGESRKGDDSQTLYTGFSVKKYLDEDYKDPVGQLSKTDKIIFRLAEMYLIRAEAAFYLNIGDKGLADINTIRARAGMPARTSMTESYIRYERMAELCFEDGARYWDLIRWRTAQNAITKDFSGIRLIKDFSTGKYLVRFETYTGTASPYESFFRAEHYYKPITPNRISNNPNLAPENPGY